MMILLSLTPNSCFVRASPYFMNMSWAGADMPPSSFPPWQWNLARSILPFGAFGEVYSLIPFFFGERGLPNTAPSM